MLRLGGGYPALTNIVPVQHADSFPAVHLANTFLSLAISALSTRPIILVATAQGTTSLHPLLSSTHLLGETVSLRGPDKRARRDVRLPSLRLWVTLPSV